MTERPDLPTVVQVGPHRVAVIVDEDEHNRIQIAARASMYGQYDPGPNRITIKPGLHPDQEADTLLHELIHALQTCTGLTASGAVLEDTDTAEVVSAALAPALLDMLRRNPSLVAYLCSDHS